MLVKIKYAIILGLFIVCVLSVNSCNKSEALSYIQDNVTNFLDIKHSDLKLLGSDFSRIREPVAIYEVTYNIISPDLKILLNDDKNLPDSEQLKRINYYLRCAKLQEIKKSDEINGFSEKSESSFSFILIRKYDNLVCIYLGGI